MGKVYGVIIGLNEYLFLPDLKFAERDARQFYYALLGKIKGEPNLLLLSSDSDIPPTKAVIFRIINEFAAEASNDDTFIFYFSGHGGFINGSDRIILSDGNINDNSLIEETTISIGDLINLLARTKFKQVMIVIDSCRSDLRDQTKDALALSFKKSINMDFSKSIPKSPNLLVVYSTSHGELSHEIEEKKQSLFTYTLVKLIKESTKITKELFEQIPYELKKIATELGKGKIILKYKQRPTIIEEGQVEIPLKKKYYIPRKYEKVKTSNETGQAHKELTLQKTQEIEDFDSYYDTYYKKQKFLESIFSKIQEIDIFAPYSRKWRFLKPVLLIAFLVGIALLINISRIKEFYIKHYLAPRMAPKSKIQNVLISKKKDFFAVLYSDENGSFLKTSSGIIYGPYDQIQKVLLDDTSNSVLMSALKNGAQFLVTFSSKEYGPFSKIVLPFPEESEYPVALCNVENDLYLIFGKYDEQCGPFESVISVPESRPLYLYKASRDEKVYIISNQGKQFGPFDYIERFIVKGNRWVAAVKNEGYLYVQDWMGKLSGPFSEIQKLKIKGNRWIGKIKKRDSKNWAYIDNHGNDAAPIVAYIFWHIVVLLLCSIVVVIMYGEDILEYPHIRRRMIATLISCVLGYIVGFMITILIDSHLKPGIDQLQRAIIFCAPAAIIAALIAKYYVSEHW